ncbi:hypothetical protein GCM10023187_52760 [Nibrella viscosa]|uniref:Thioredoxin domain-containing protein n=1 Tax=Nibrella viscosa TaxID=1084524 RepID=A0ABP8KYK0_9BACT
MSLMRFSVLICTFLYVSVSASAAAPSPGKGIQFAAVTWKEALQQAKTSRKLIFVDAYASWCGPCKLMAARVFTDDKVAAYYNEQFINVKMDMESEEGEVFGESYPVEAYPTFLFIDGEGKLVHRQTGAMPAQEFIQLGEDAQNPEKQTSAIEQRLKANLNTPEGVTAYLEYLADNDQPTDSVAEAYFKQIPPRDWMLTANWELLDDYIKSAGSPVIRHIEEHRPEFEAGIGRSKLNEKLQALYKKSIKNLLAETPLDTTAYRDMTNRLLLSLKEENKPKVRFYLAMAAYASRKDTVGLINETIRYVEIENPDVDKLKEYAHMFYKEFENSPLAQAKALEWSRTATEIESDYDALSQYALSLHRAGQTQQALLYARKAVEEARTSEDGDYRKMKALIARLSPQKPVRKKAVPLRAKRG